MIEAIKLAIQKGGYEPFKSLHMEFCSEVHYFSDWLVVVPGAGGTAQKHYADIILDPRFWQALGRVLGWAKNPKAVGGWYRQSIIYFEMHMDGNDDKFWKGVLHERN